MLTSIIAQTPLCTGEKVGATFPAFNLEPPRLKTAFRYKCFDPFTGILKYGY